MLTHSKQIRPNRANIKTGLADIVFVAKKGGEKGLSG